jgi:hypothetical protein
MDKMKHKREKSGRPLAADSNHPEQLLFEEMQVIPVTMKQVHKESARLRAQSLAVNTELAGIVRGDSGGRVALPATENHGQDKPDESNYRAVPRLPENGDQAADSRAGALQVLTAANQNLREAGYDAVDIIDAAMNFALDRLLQTVGRADAVRYLRYVSEQIEGQAH